LWNLTATVSKNEKR